MTRPTLLLDASQVRELLPPEDCIAAVEAGLLGAALGASPGPGVLGMPTNHGGFHVKAAALQMDRHYFVAKLNGNFPANPARHGLPTIQGLVILCDADTGTVLAVMDSAELTRLRTGAATAVAAKQLARPESRSVLVFGCGRQAGLQVACLQQVLPLATVSLYDRDRQAATRLAGRISTELGLAAEVLDEEHALQRARGSDVIVTCTPSNRFFLRRSQVGQGCFVAAVGADDSGKQELEPALLAGSTVVVDVLEQCARIGELHHALDAAVMTRDDVHAELGDILAGRRPGRLDPLEITIFDSTGTALEDVAAAAMVFERATALGRGSTFAFAGDDAS
jgi:alanine dehydrogenase